MLGDVLAYLTDGVELVRGQRHRRVRRPAAAAHRHRARGRDACSGCRSRSTSATGAAAASWRSTSPTSAGRCRSSRCSWSSRSGPVGSEQFGPYGRAGLATLIALVLFALPPLITNAYVGITEVDRDIVEAARGMGMSGAKVFTARSSCRSRCRWCMTGVRLALVQVWATATIAALVAGPGPGPGHHPRVRQPGAPTRWWPARILVALGALLLEGLAVLRAVRRPDAPGPAAAEPRATYRRPSRRLSDRHRLVVTRCRWPAATGLTRVPHGCPSDTRGASAPRDTEGGAPMRILRTLALTPRPAAAPGRGRLRRRRLPRGRGLRRRQRRRRQGQRSSSAARTSPRARSWPRSTRSCSRTRATTSRPSWSRPATSTCPSSASGNVDIVPDYLAGITDFLNTEENGAGRAAGLEQRPRRDARGARAAGRGAGHLDPAAVGGHRPERLLRDHGLRRGRTTSRRSPTSRRWASRSSSARPEDCAGRADCEGGLERRLRPRHHRDRPARLRQPPGQGRRHQRRGRARRDRHDRRHPRRPRPDAARGRQGHPAGAEPHPGGQRRLPGRQPGPRGRSSTSSPRR